MQYDVIVIGAGIAGASVAHFLARAGKRVCVIDRHEHPFGGASQAAGAFLSPMMGRGSQTMALVNRALSFSLELYAQIAPHALIKGGVLRYPKPKESLESFLALTAYLQTLAHRRWRGGVFFPEAGMIQPDQLAEALLRGCDFKGGVAAHEPHYHQGSWHVASWRAPCVVVATGAYPSILPDGWMGRKGVWGERLALKTALQRRYNISAAVAISATLPDQTVAVGATHRRGVEQWRVDPLAAQALLEEAISLDRRLMQAEIVDIKGGMRPANNDYLPAVGAFSHAARLAKEQPLLFKGAKLQGQMPLYPGLYIHSGHGGRGFVTAPYTGWLLAEHILKQGELPEFLRPDRLLLRHFRRQREPGCYDYPSLKGVE